MSVDSISLKYLIPILRKVSNNLPNSVVNKIAILTGYIISPFFSKEREISRHQILLVKKHLKTPSPLSQVEPKQIFRKSLTHLILSISEVLRIRPLLGYNKTGTRHVTCDNLNIMEECRNQDKALIALSGHIGCFELLAAYFADKGIPITAVGRTPKITWVAEFVDDLRKGYGVKTLWRGEEGSSGVLRRTIADKDVLALLIDQDFETNNLFSPFFSFSAAYPKAPLEIAKKFDLPIVSVFIMRISPDEHKIVIKKIEPDWQDPDCFEYILKKYSQHLEECINNYPEQWLWWHRRWRRTPDTESLRSTEEYVEWLKLEANNNIPCLDRISGQGIRKSRRDFPAR